MLSFSNHKAHFQNSEGFGGDTRADRRKADWSRKSDERCARSDRQTVSAFDVFLLPTCPVAHGKAMHLCKWETVHDGTWLPSATLCCKSIKDTSAESNNNYTQTSLFCFLSRLAVVLFHCNSFHWPFLYKLTDVYNGHFCSYTARASNMIQYSIMMQRFEAPCIWKLKTEFVLCCQSALFRRWCESFLYFQTYWSTAGVFNLLGHAPPPSLSNFTRAPPPQKKIFFFCSFWLTLFTQEMHGSVILMYIWYLLYCLRSLETTDCAYEDTPQDSHWYTPAVSGLFTCRA